MSTSATPATFRDLLSAQLRSDPARPLVTFYDDATGERIELSVATYANWVSKTAGLAQDELGLERGDLVLLVLPTHWLGAVWLGACWTSGLCVTTDPALREEATLVVCGPDDVDRYADLAQDREVVALSLRPLGGRFTEPLPDGVVDFGAVVLAQPDTFTPYDPATGDDAAWRDARDVLTQSTVIRAASDEPQVHESGRLLTDVNPCSAEGISTLVSPLLESAATVWVANPDPSAWEKRYDEERATDQRRATLSS